MRRLVAGVLIAAAALCARADQGVNQKKGFNAENVYFAHDIDAVNAFNGNLTVTVPIGQRFPLADGLSYGLTAVNNSNVWEAENLYEVPDLTPDGRSIATEADGLCHSEDGVMFAHPSRRSNAGLGWNLTLGRLFEPFVFPGERMSEWTYESPDGADHKFGAGLDGSRTMDGSNLRMLYDSSTETRVIEFPDGIRHTFKRTSMDTAWMPTRIENRFGAYLNIAYLGAGEGAAGDLVPAGMYRWELVDSHGRRHRVMFRKKNWEGSGRFVVETVELEGFNGSRPKYTFVYTEDDIGRQTWAERCPGYFVNATIQVLDRIEFPDDPSTTTEGATQYSFQYDRGNDWLGTNGLLTEAKLPTGARIVWGYGQYAQTRTNYDAPSPWIDMAWGVNKRILSPGSVTTPQDPTWTYAYILNADYDPNTTGDNGEYVHQGRSLAIDAEGNQTLSFFSVYVCAPTECTGAVQPYFWSEYGKPFTREHADGDYFLSQVQYAPGVAFDVEDPLEGALRATYVKYESDYPPRQSEPDEENWRLKATRVKSFDAQGLVTEVTTTASSDWDGFGHYRVTEAGGSTTSKTKKTTTHYNPHLTPTSVIPTDKPWILNTYDYVQTEYDGQSARVDVCYDTVAGTSYPSTGFVTRKRIARDLQEPEPRKDLLTVYTPTADGNVATEGYFGGDYDLLPPSFTTCTSWPDTPSIQLTHSYSFGVRSQSRYSGVTFKSLDLTVDKTGLTQASRDSAGVETTFVYNPAGQLRKAIPASEAWTEYSYNVNPAGSPPGTVTVKQWPSGNLNPGSSEVPLTESRYYYDAAGRLVQQATSLGGLAAGASGATRWAVSTTTYDKLGRKWKVSVPVTRSSGDFASVTAPLTVFTYDALGRTTDVTQPDLSHITTAYPRPSRTVTTNVVQSANAGGDVQLSVATTEDYDPFGRLVAVTENSASAPNYLTEYTYDEGDRLVHVKQGVQDRDFFYDDAGLLTSEVHPESGTTSYLYDARGHVRSQATPTATILNSYDTAERITGVSHNGVVLKSFTYDTATMGLGKIATATRVNDHGSVGRYTVKETFGYAPNTGRIQSKITEVVKVRNGVTESTTRFQDQYGYDELGANTSVTYPECTTGCGTLPPLNRVVENQYSNGLLKKVPGYTGDITYHPNGLIAEFRRVNAGGGAGPLYKQDIAANGMPRPSAITVTGQCTNLSITTPPVATKTVNKDAPAGLFVVASGATGFQWYAAGSSTVLGTGDHLDIAVGQTTTYYVRVLNGTCSLDSTESVVTVNVTVPTAITGSATSITLTGATLNGTVNPNGSATTTAFEYGLTTGYGSSVSAQPLSGSSPQSISATVTGLTCGTLYYFRAKGTNPGGPHSGAQATFTTSACTQVSAPSISTNAVTSIGQSGATFNATVNPNGAETTITFEYGPTPSFGSTTPTQVRFGTTNQSVSNVVSLACGTTYNVHAKATNTGGTSYGIDRTFSTLACSNPCTVQAISYGGSVTGTLSATSCTSGARGPGYYTAIYSFTGTTGDQAQINMDSDDVDTFLYLKSPSGAVVASNDDSNGTWNPQVSHTLASSGTWTIHATTYGQGAVGTYDLSLRKCSETITTPASLTRSLSGGSCAASLRGEEYYGSAFSFAGIAGKSVVIDMTSTQIDSFLYLVAPDGIIAAVNDDSNGTYNSHIQYVLPVAGTWTIHTSSYSPGETGTYQLTVDQVTCPAIDATITAPASVCAGATETASAPLAASYLWSIQNGTITSSTTARIISFRPTGAMPVTLFVDVTSSCGATSSDTATVTVSNPTATLSGNFEIAQGGSQEIVANLTGTPPWNVVWAPGNITQQVTTQPARLTVQPGATTHYTIAQIIDSTGCAGTSSGEAVVTVVPPAPTQLSATATSATAVQLTWSFGGSADHFAIERCPAACSTSSSWVPIGTATPSNYLDLSAAANKSYLYRVRASKGGTSSLPSTAEVATTVVLGADVVPNTVVEDDQIVPLRTAVQAMTMLAGTAPPAITDANLQYAVVLSVHLGELRAALNAARASLGLPAVVYSTSTSSIRAADVNELRGGVR